MTEKIKISVLMPVYNCELYIKEAIDSILNQTFSNFELLIIDDCSTDKTLGIIKSYSDSRIQIIEKDKNTGLSNSLNYGLQIAKGEYIARMDGDDFSFPQRFEYQIDFLENNPDYVLCGTQFEYINSSEVNFVPLENDDIMLEFLIRNTIVHSSVMMRNEVLKHNNLFYVNDNEPAEDYHLWVKLISLGKFKNLEKVLLKYRIHENQVSESSKEKQIEKAVLARIKFLE
jgi:glycosyltransferase involved in cell wall biosynthesis